MWQWSHTVEAVRLAVLWILKRLLFNGRENVTSEEKFKMTAGIQLRSCSRGLNCLPLFSLHLAVYLVLSLSESVTGYDCIQSQGVCCLSTPGLRQSKWCTEQPFCLHTHARHYSLIRAHSVRSVVTQKCSGVYWLRHLVMTSLLPRRWQTPNVLTSEGMTRSCSLGKKGLVWEWYNGCSLAGDKISESLACHELARESQFHEYYSWIKKSHPSFIQAYSY